MTSIKGVLFDKDGTLFDFNATWGVWTQQLLEQESQGDPAVLSDLCKVLGYDVHQQIFQPGSIVIAATAGEVADAILTVIPGDKDALLERMTGQTANVPQVEAAPLRPLLGELKERGLKLGIATNDAEISARANLGQAGVDTLFDFIAGYDSGFGGKPATGQMEAFCAAVNLQPDACVMVGDSLHDIHAGQSAGMKTVGVLTGPAPRSELAPHADVVLNSIADLPHWLDQTN